MSTRAGTAAHSRNVQQRLVRLLFDHKFAGIGREQHKKLDFASYSYAELKSAYLERIQTTHPDKFFNMKEIYRNSKRPGVVDGSVDGEYTIEQGDKVLQHDTWDKRDATTYFIQLQETWKAYENFYKNVRQNLGEQGEADFTMFGVGCSFSDNPEERELRNEIMDQACKGWFSAGSLCKETSHLTNDVANSASTNKVTKRSTLISEDELFINVSEADKAMLVKVRKRSLVENLRPKRNL